MNLRKIGNIYYLLFLLMVILAVYLYFFSFMSPDYTPYYGDEYFYFKNSEGFYLTNSIKAVFTYSGNGSLIFGADAHGPAYPLIYGSIAKLIGWGGLTIPLINLGFLLLAILALVWNKNASKEVKTLQVLLILGSPITLFYSITYMPELLQITGAIVLYILIKRYLNRQTLKNFIVLLFVITLLGAIRSTWFFALFGLMVLPGPIKSYYKCIYLILGLALPFAFQHYFHEQVPNVFSELGEIADQQGLKSAIISVVENFTKNITYAFTYAAGDFYLMQKIWLYSSLFISITLFRKDLLIRSGLVIIASVILFNMILYENYNFVDLRMYTPMTIFLNLGMIANQAKIIPVLILFVMNLCSFILTIPLQQVLIDNRVPSKNLTISKKLITKLKNLDDPIVYIDTTVLYKYKIVDLPILTNSRKPITYILPYYCMDMKTPSHFLIEENDHWYVKSFKILNQKTIPRIVCKP